MGLAAIAPLFVLCLRAFEAEPGAIRDLLLRQRNLELVGNTAALMVAVVAGSMVLALPTAWLSTRTNWSGRKLLALVAALPLAMPGYVLALSLLALSSPQGPFASLFGWHPPRVAGFWGAALALTLYNFPFVFLNVRAALQKLDLSMLEAARSLGQSPSGVFFTVVLPTLKPSLLAGALLVSLYVLGDFGVVSLMRFETLSYAVFLQYTAAFDRVYASLLALVMLFMTLGLVWGEWRILGNLRLDRSSSPRDTRPMPLGLWAVPAIMITGTAVILAIIIPIGTLVFWWMQNDFAWPGSSLAIAAQHTLWASVPAAILAVAGALPLAWLVRRYPSIWSTALERTAHVAYAVPPLALALGIIVLTLRFAPGFYQTLFALVTALAVHCLALALGPLRSSLMTASPQLENASRSLGENLFSTFRRVTLPLLRPGLSAGFLLALLFGVKELPITYLLSPLDFQPLALRIYGYASEALFAEAAPYALMLILTSTVLASASLLINPEK